MFPFLRSARWLGLVVILWLSASPLFTQVLTHPPHPDPAAQKAAFEAQQAILESPNQFGTNCCQILQIPASSFTSFDPGSGQLIFGPTYGYEAITNGGPGAGVWATVTLPSGVAVDFLDLYFWDNDASFDICVALQALTGTTSPGTSTIMTTCSSGNPGYGYASNLITGTTINNNVISGGAQYVLQVYELFVTPNLAFKGVDIWWHRQVSPAPGVATFNDVPTNHPFFQFVEALSASGITVGCQVSPPLYCPDAPLTRKQMAAFLSKALGLYWQY